MTSSAGPIAAAALISPRCAYQSITVMIVTIYEQSFSRPECGRLSTLLIFTVFRSTIAAAFAFVLAGPAFDYVKTHRALPTVTKLIPPGLPIQNRAQLPMDWSRSHGAQTPWS